MAIASKVESGQAYGLDMFDYCNVPARAYRKAFAGMRAYFASFIGATLWYVDASQFISALLPRDLDALNDIVSKEELISMLERKCKLAFQETLDVKISVQCSEYVDIKRTLCSPQIKPYRLQRPRQTRKC